MGWIWTIIIGFVIGVLAKFVHPGKENLGFITTTLLGIAGSVAATVIGQAIGWYGPEEPAGFIVSAITAVLLLAVYTRVVKKK